MIPTRLIGCLILLQALCALAALASDPPTPTADEVLKYLGFEGKDRKELFAGNIISKDWDETSDKELAITLALMLPRTLPETKVEDLPSFALAHRLFYLRLDGAFIAERQYYVQRSYNSLQIIIGFLPHGQSTLVFYTNRTSTDQAAGFPQGLRHSMGRKALRQSVIEHLESVRAMAREKPRPR